MFLSTQLLNEPIFPEGASLMRSKYTIAFLITFLLTVLFSNLQTVQADALPTPTATSLSGDADFSIKVVEQAQLAGVSTYNNLLVPSGFPLGEKQFEGEGLSLSGLSYGSVSLCFPLKATSQGWGGKVGYWNGNSWKLLDTMITTPTESTVSWACVTADLNGQYALIKWVVDPSLLPKTASSKPACTFSVYTMFIIGDALPDLGDGYITAQAQRVLLFPSEDLTGKTVSVKYISSSPADTFLFDGQATNMFITSGTLQPYMGIFYSVDIPSGHIFKLKNLHEYTETYSLDFGDCIIVQTQGISD